MGYHLVCPKCGHKESSASSWGDVAVTTLVAGGLLAGVGFLVGGPVGAAAGGGFGGKLAQAMTNRACKETGKAIGMSCPICGARMKEEW